VLSRATLQQPAQILTADQRLIAFDRSKLLAVYQLIHAIKAFVASAFAAAARVMCVIRMDLSTLYPTLFLTLCQQF
jgi:hypothetical protein